MRSKSSMESSIPNQTSAIAYGTSGSLTQNGNRFAPKYQQSNGKTFPPMPNSYIQAPQQQQQQQQQTSGIDNRRNVYTASNVVRSLSNGRANIASSRSSAKKSTSSGGQSSDGRASVLGATQYDAAKWAERTSANRQHYASKFMSNSKMIQQQHRAVRQSPSDNLSGIINNLNSALDREINGEEENEGNFADEDDRIVNRVADRNGIFVTRFIEERKAKHALEQM